VILSSGVTYEITFGSCIQTGE